MTLLGSPWMATEVLVCKECGNKTFYLTYQELHSDPPWHIFGCRKCFSLWAINVINIWDWDGDKVLYRKGSPIREEGKPFTIINKEGKVSYFSWPPGRSEKPDWNKYRNRPPQGPAVGYYDTFK